MTPTEVLDRIEQLFTERGGNEYHGEAVTQLEHALQAAYFAEKDGCATTLIVAALLHDIGHLLHGHTEDCATQGIDDRHEELGVRFLARVFGSEVTEPVRLHVAAKRYLCATQPNYSEVLSPASEQSLTLQGGPMSPEEVREFEASSHFVAAVKLREYDDRAKVVNQVTPTLAHFRQYMEAVGRADS